MVAIYIAIHAGHCMHGAIRACMHACMHSTESHSHACMHALPCYIATYMHNYFVNKLINSFSFVKNLSTHDIHRAAKELVCGFAACM